MNRPTCLLVSTFAGAAAVTALDYAAGVKLTNEFLALAATSSAVMSVGFDGLVAFLADEDKDKRRPAELAGQTALTAIAAFSTTFLYITTP